MSAAPPSTPGRSSWHFHVLAAAPAVLLLAFQAPHVWPFFSDDSFISLRYAERLLDGHGLTWTDAADGAPERVEGYSNLVWVLLVAGAAALGVEFVDAARLLGALATMAALYLLARATRPHDLRTTLLAAVAPLLVAATQPVLVWTLAGLEGPLLLLLLSWGFAGVAHRTFVEPDPTRWSARALFLLGAPFALACWTRPDGPLWALACGAGIACMALGGGPRAAVTRALWFGAPAVTAVLAQLVFRVAYYGDWVPNTAHVKAELDVASLGPGFAYVRAAALAMPGLCALALFAAAALFVRARPRAFVLTLLLPVLAWAAYLTAIGGDHFPGFRLLHGALAPLALLAGLGLRALGRGLPVAVAAAAVALAAATVDALRARSHPRTAEARAERWEWHGEALGEALRAAFADRAPNERPLLAVDAAGALPFYSELPALDLLGLCDRTIATTPFPDWLDTVKAGTPKPPGHLRGNGDYAISRRPDLMLFSRPPGLPLPVFVSACEFEDDPRFVGEYRCVLLDLGEVEVAPDAREPHIAPLWVRTEGRAGVRRDDDRVVVPAYLFESFVSPGASVRRHQPPTGDAATDGEAQRNLVATAQWYTSRRVRVVPSADGALRLAMPDGFVANFTTTLPAGRWRLTTEPAVPDAARFADRTGPTIELDLARPVALSLSAAAGGAVDRVVLVRE